jgi:hypothetical protein
VDLKNALNKLVDPIRHIIDSAKYYTVTIYNPAPASEGAPGGKALEVFTSDGVTPLIRANDDGVYSVGGPTGAIIMWPTATPPLGWLICDGRNSFPHNL